MKQTPLVSVVMPCYNSSKYLKKAIDSILNQTLKDFEFIIVDDGSTDTTKNIIESYNDPKIKYVYKENGGIGSALKLGCALARGKYIARMDSDDICFADRFQKQVDFLESNDKYILVSSAVIYIDDQSKILGRSFPYQNDAEIKEILIYDSPIAHPAVVFLREAYNKTGGYIELVISEEFYLWNLMKRFGRFYNLCVPLLYYRVLYTSLSHTLSHDFHSFVNREVYRLSCQDRVTLQDICDINAYILNNRTHSENFKNKISKKVYLMWEGTSYVLGVRLSSKLFCNLKIVLKWILKVVYQ
jgi:glycosyltransferase involved in cell wall biosynthesis